jgi:hypothetical protein
LLGVVVVSTVFLGLDHSFGEGPPLLFETMVFVNDMSGRWMDRCSTWAEAERQHGRGVIVGLRYLVPGIAARIAQHVRSLWRVLRCAARKDPNQH